MSCAHAAALIVLSRCTEYGRHMTNPAITTDRLSKSYGASVALDAMTLEVASGEVFGLLGHNGAGKTTTVNVLTTLLVSCVGSSLEWSFEGVEDLFCGFGPDEWLRVLIPTFDPLADVGFESLNAAVVAALQ
jgi:ABC transporter